MDNKEAQALLLKYESGTCTNQEIALLESWFIQLKSEQEAHGLETHLLEADLNEVWNVLDNSYQLTANTPKVVSLHKNKKPIKKWLTVAASIVLVTAIGFWMYNLRDPRLKTPSEGANQILSGKNTAVLTLSNGKQMMLSDAKSGVIISSGQVIYDDSTAVAIGAHQHNVLANQQLIASTPRGGTYQVTLPDGTKVWLNAASTLRFPSSFAGNKQRSISLDGEAYFEVAKDKKHPFIVRTKQQDVEVLGTHFNINAYAEEKITKTVLIEGAVKISLIRTPGNKTSHSEPNNVMLKPGQQSVLGNNSIKVSDADIEETMAWKNGYFRFNKAKITTVMQQLSRWYDITVSYEGEVSEEEFSGTASNRRPITEVLNMLQYSKSVHFKIEGRRVTVTK